MREVNTYTTGGITENDFLQYPDLETFKIKLHELRNLDLSNAEKDYIGETLFNYLPVIPSLASKFSSINFNRFNFYRVRLNINAEAEDLRLIRTYSYPLPQFCNDNGRANIKNKSVFYCSNSALTAVIESKPKVGDIGYLSCWQGCTDREIKAGVLLPRELKEENEWYVVAKDAYSFAEDQINRVGLQRNGSLFHEALHFIASLYLTEQAPYALTSWISNSLIYGSAWKDLVIYPSFVNDSYSSNFAIHPNVVDNYLKFRKVIKFKVIKIDNTGYTCSTGAVGELVQNNIIFRAAINDELDLAKLPY